MHDGYLEQFHVTSFKNTFYFSKFEGIFSVLVVIYSLFPDLTYNLNYWWANSQSLPEKRTKLIGSYGIETCDLWFLSTLLLKLAEYGMTVYSHLRVIVYLFHAEVLFLALEEYIAVEDKEET